MFIFTTLRVFKAFDPWTTRTSQPSKGRGAKKHDANTGFGHKYSLKALVNKFSYEGRVPSDLFEMFRFIFLLANGMACIQGEMDHLFGQNGGPLFNVFTLINLHMFYTLI